MSLDDAAGKVITSSSGNFSANASLIGTLAAGTYFVDVSNSSSNTDYNLSLSATPIVDGAGNSLATAHNIGALGASPVSFSDFVGPVDSVDYYRFSVTNTTTVDLLLSGLTTTTEFDLYDSLGNQITLASGSATSAGSIVQTLTSGTYYVGVSSLFSSTDYNLSVTTGTPTVGVPTFDGAGNSTAGARNIGALSTAQTFADWVGAADTDDYYKFTLTAPAAVSLALSGVLGQTEESLLDAAGDQITSAYANATSNVSNSNGSIIQNLAAGTYYLDIHDLNTDTGYSVTLSASAIADNAGSTTATAKSIGTLGDGTVHTLSDYVGSVDPHDFYSFTLTAPTEVHLDLVGSASTAGLLAAFTSLRLDDAGGSEITSNSGTGNVSLNNYLAAGTYYVDVSSTDSTGVDYKLAVDGELIPDGAGNTIATAKSLGNLGTVQTYSDFVGGVDPDDVYSFTLTAASTINLDLSGIFSNASLNLDDASGEFLKGVSGSSGQDASMIVDLAAGNYFIDVHNTGSSQGLENYNLSASATTIPDQAGSTLATADNLGALGAAGLHVSDTTSGAFDPIDMYEFTLGSTATVDAELSSTNPNSVFMTLLNSAGKQLSTNDPSDVQTLTAGTYYIEINTPSTNVVNNYTLSLSTATPTVGTSATDGAGNTIAAARVIPINGTTQDFADWVGSTDTDDFYSITLASPSTINIDVSGITGSLTQRTFIEDPAGHVLTTINATANSNGVLSEDLAAGTYYIDVNAPNSVNTGYNLSFSDTTIPDIAGNTLATAMSVGTLTAAAQTFSDTVGTVDTDDYYSFTLSATSTVDLQLSGLSLETELKLVDAGGHLISSDTGNSIGNDSVIDNLGPGTYFVDVYNQGFSGDTPYTLSLSANAIPDGAGNTPATAFDVGELEPDIDPLSLLDAAAAPILVNGTPTAANETALTAALIAQLSPLDGAATVNYSTDASGDLVATVADGSSNVVNTVTYLPNGATTDVHVDATTGDIATTSVSIDQNGNATINQILTNATGQELAAYTLNPDGTSSEVDDTTTGALSRYKAVNADGSYSTSNNILGTFRGDTLGNADGSSRTEQVDNGKTETYTTVDTSGNLVSTGFDTSGTVDRYEVGNQDLDLVKGQMVYYQRESQSAGSVSGESIQVDAAGDVLEYSDLTYGSNVDGVAVTTGGTVTLYYAENLGTHEGVEGQWNPAGGSLLEYSDLNSAGTGYAYSAIYGSSGGAAASAYQTTAGVSVTLLGTNYAGYWQTNANATEVANLSAALTQDLALNSADAFVVPTAGPSGIGFQDLYQQVAIALPDLVAAADTDLSTPAQAALAQILSSADTKGALLAAYPDGSIASHLSNLSDTLILPSGTSDPKAQLFTDATAFVGDLLSADVEAAVVAPGMLAGLEAGSVSLAQLAQAMASFGAADASSELTAAGSAFTAADVQYIAANPTGATQIIQGAAQAVFTHLYAGAHL